MKLKEAALGLSLLAAGCAHTATTSAIKASVDTQDTQQQSAPLEKFPIEESLEIVAQRIREQCGDFSFILNDGHNGSEFNTNTMVLYNVSPDKATLECIAEAGIGSKTWCKVCIPVPGLSKPKLGDPDKMTLTIDCRDIY